MVVEAAKGAGHIRLGDLIVLKNREFDPREAARRQEALERLWAEAARLPTKTLGNFAASGVSIVPGMLEPLVAEYLLPYGLDGESVVFDGAQRRGVLFFAIPEETEAGQWEVGSLSLAGLSQPVGEQEITGSLERMKRLTLEDPGGGWFWEQVGEVVSELIVQRHQEGYRKPGGLRAKRVALEADSERGEPVPAPAITALGSRRMKEIATLAELKPVFDAIRWLPMEALPWQQRYAPEAVLTQGWGGASDLARIAETVLNRNGIETRRILVEVTDRGRQALAKRAGLPAVEKEQLPALWYRDGEGREQVLVAPFMREAADLSGLILYDPGQGELEESAEKAHINIRLLVKAKGRDRQRQAADLADALAGDSDSLEEINLLSTSISLTDLSRDAVDIGYTKAAENGRILYRAVLDGPSGRIETPQGEGIDSSKYQVVGEVLEIGVDYQTHNRRRLLGEGMDITGVFHTLGINLPDLGGDSVQALQRAGEAARRHASGEPDTLSALRWLGRNTLARFIAAQSAYEKEFSDTLGLITGRTGRGRVLLATNRRAETPGSPLITTMDLLHPFNQIHGEADPRAASAFHILSGITAARIEAEAVPGGGGDGALRVLGKEPPGDATDRHRRRKPRPVHRGPQGQGLSAIASAAPRIYRAHYPISQQTGADRRTAPLGLAGDRARKLSDGVGSRYRRPGIPGGEVRR
ncbi:MAG: hypothetical protein B0D87_08350 [Candidatus Sedimenticola endophacoides]|nr:MAG: hypothetical protein B0D94_02365 [Candidatus Sedimenticola endophacoides]OQX47887.1 MAG: hypothetical protein B0D87_08350 [Candidatus Sedimenticola endophacoides]